MTLLTYRTTDGTKWGGGLGSDLSATQIDDNFWELESAIEALQDHAAMAGAGIAYFAVAGTNLYVHMTDHTVLGPYTIPTSQWTFRGAWAAVNPYNPMDVVTNGGAVYLILITHTSAASFSAGANDGMGHNYYGLILANPSNIIPSGGVAGQRLVKNSATAFDTLWKNDTRNVAVYIGQPPLSNELLVRYVSPDIITFPSGLTGSETSSGTVPTHNVSYILQKNGAAVGALLFEGGSQVVNINFSVAVTLNPGDYLDIIAPVVPDDTHANFSICLVANIAG